MSWWSDTTYQVFHEISNISKPTWVNRNGDISHVLRLNLTYLIGQYRGTMISNVELKLIICNRIIQECNLLNLNNLQIKRVVSTGFIWFPHSCVIKTILDVFFFFIYWVGLLSILCIATSIVPFSRVVL